MWQALVYLNTALIILGFLWVVLYATWLFGYRLRKGEGVRKSFLAWLRDLLEAVTGI